MARPKGRTAGCDRDDARDRLSRAEEFLAVAELAWPPRAKRDAWATGLWLPSFAASGGGR